jgi:hypothetical protein
MSGRCVKNLCQFIETNTIYLAYSFLTFYIHTVSITSTSLIRKQSYPVIIVGKFLLEKHKFTKRFFFVFPPNFRYTIK